MDADALFDQIAVDLAPRGVLPGALFGARSLTYEGRAFASFKGERCAIKLGAESPGHAEGLALGEPFDPSGKGRPMKDWIAVGPSHADAWHRLVEAALDLMVDGDVG